MRRLVALNGVDEIALAFDRACRAAGVEYAFMGAFAVMAWGEPRATTDVGVLVAYDEERIPAFVTALRAESLSADFRDLIDAQRDRGHVSVFREGSVFWLDLRLARTAVERGEIADAASVEVRGQALRVVRPEDTIAFKLSFGSPKDLQDALSILVRQAGALDESRLLALAHRLGVADALSELRKRIPGQA